MKKSPIPNMDRFFDKLPKDQRSQAEKLLSRFILDMSDALEEAMLCLEERQGRQLPIDFVLCVQWVDTQSYVSSAPGQEVKGSAQVITCGDFPEIILSSAMDVLMDQAEPTNPGDPSKVH